MEQSLLGKIASALRGMGGAVQDPQFRSDVVGGLANALRGGLADVLPTGAGPIMARNRGLPEDPNYRSKMTDLGLAGLTVMPKTKTEFEIAHKLAQERAALPVEKGGLGLPSNNTSEQRAMAMGFNTDVYHGTTNDFLKFVGRHPTYATDEPRIADIYANATGRHAALRNINAAPNVMPLKLAGKEMTVSDLGENGGGWYSDNLAAALGIPRTRGMINDLPNYGIDRLRVTEMSDLGGIQTQHMIPANSDNIRSRFAAFDPWRRNAAIAAAMGVAAPDLLASEK